MKTLLALLSGCEIMEHLEMSGMGCLLQNGGNRSGRREEEMVVDSMAAPTPSSGTADDGIWLPLLNTIIIVWVR